MKCQFCTFDRGLCPDEKSAMNCPFREHRNKMDDQRKDDCIATFCGWSPKNDVCIWEFCQHSKKEEAVLTSYRQEEKPLPCSGMYPHDRWNTLIDSTIEEIKKLGFLKGGEYSGDFDRLANFRRNGANLELPMETVWAIYATKHWDALMQYIKDEREGTKRARMEPIAGRVDDLLVYLLLFKAMLDEKGEINVSAKA